MNKRVFLSSPHMGGKEILNVQDAFTKNYIAPLGEYVDKFEDVISKYINVKSAAALVSGTSAIHLALKILDVKEGDYVFCSSLTFSGSCNPIMYEKAIPVFIDSEFKTYNMSPKALEKAFMKVKPKAVIVVNLYGQSADYDKIKEICSRYKTPIIEDAAESLGATYKEKQTGTFGDIGIFSFNGNKIITTSGGGMLVSDNIEYVEKAKFLATQAREKVKHYEHKEIGYNYRLSNISAAIGVGQMEILNDRIKKKAYIFDKYKKGFENITEISMMPISENCKSNYWLSVISIDKNSKVKPVEIIEALDNENIEARHVWKPMHKQPIFEKYMYFKESNIDVSNEIYENGICLPSDTKMTDEEISRIINTIKKLF